MGASFSLINFDQQPQTKVISKQGRTSLKLGSNELDKNSDLKVILDRNAALAFELHEALKAESHDNLLYSQLSLSFVFAMVKLGALGVTKQEIEKVFGFPNDDDVLVNGYEHLLSSLRVPNDDYILKVANKLFSTDLICIKRDFSLKLHRSFDAQIEQLNFKNPKESANDINMWVKEQTDGLIKNIISPDELTKDTALLLINSIYFKGTWKTAFNKYQTKKSKFYLNTKDTVQVDMMCRQGQFDYVNLKEFGADAISLPYKGDQMCMLILVPKSRTGLLTLEEKLKLKDIQPQAILKKMSNREINLQLPKFQIESELNLVEPMKKLGVQSIFDKNLAQLNGISDSPLPLFVSNIIQKAFIEVDEEGTKAAVVTSMILAKRTSCRPQAMDLIVDRPFLFYVMNKSDNNQTYDRIRVGGIIFTGRCTEPKFSNGKTNDHSGLKRKNEEESVLPRRKNKK